MHTLAVVSKIQSIEPIEGKDRIVMAKVENYDTIVSKDEFNVGDTCVFCFYDSILPEINPATKKPDFEFLRKRCWSEKYKGFRIRPMKMGGKVSEGLVLPLSVLGGKEYKLGTVVTDKLGIRLYDPESEMLSTPPKKVKYPKCIEWMCRFKWFRFLIGIEKKKGYRGAYYPIWVTKSDEENIEKCYDGIPKNRNYIITEKIEGMSTSFILEHNKFKVYSHNWGVNDGPWMQYAKIAGIEAKMRSYCKEHNLKGLCIQGELIGPSIQGNIYGNSNLDFFMFGGYYLDHTRLSWEEITNIANEMCLKTVPYIGESKPYELEDMLKDCEGFSVLENPMTKKPVPREGLVWRTQQGDVHFKVKSRSYKVWFEDKDPNAKK